MTTATATARYTQYEKNRAAAAAAAALIEHLSDDQPDSLAFDHDSEVLHLFVEDPDRAHRIAGRLLLRPVLWSRLSVWREYKGPVDLNVIHGPVVVELTTPRRLHGLYDLPATVVDAVRSWFGR